MKIAKPAAQPVSGRTLASWPDLGTRWHIAEKTPGRKSCRGFVDWKFQALTILSAKLNDSASMDALKIENDCKAFKWVPDHTVLLLGCPVSGKTQLAAPEVQDSRTRIDNLYSQLRTKISCRFTAMKYAQTVNIGNILWQGRKASGYTQLSTLWCAGCDADRKRPEFPETLRCKMEKPELLAPKSTD